MKIDILMVYGLAIWACFTFQHFFTSVNYVYDASYYVDGEMKQSSFTAMGKEVDPADLRNFISKNQGAEEVIIISFRKREAIRVFKPIWK